MCAEVRTVRVGLLGKVGLTCRFAQICVALCTATAGHLAAQTAQSAAPAVQSATNVAALPRFEVGMNFADIRTDCINSNDASCGLPQFAVGLGTSYNLSSHFAIDGNFTETPTRSKVATNFYGGHHAEYLVGLRSEARAQHYGYLLRTQVGTISWTHLITGAVNPPGGQLYFLFGDRLKFAANVAAGFEYSPWPRIHFRAEIGDLLRAFSRTVWQNNLQSMAGVYIGLGKPLMWKPVVYNAKATHPFFDSANVTLMTASVLGMTADAITTQRFISRGGVEGDPFARPLVKYGWSGQIAAEGLEINAVIWGMYGLHRIHQHWIERIAPAAVATAHGFFAYKNDKPITNSNPAP